MRTLYIDINNKPVQNTDEMICVSDNETLLNDFFYELGCSILSKSGINVPKAQLISGFNLPENVDAYAKIIKQWEELKAILFGNDVEGEFNVHLPKEYMSWLGNHSNQEYRAICRNKSYDCTKELIVTIDVKEFYDEYVNDDFIRSLVKTLRENNDIKQIVFNDDVVTRKSQIVKKLKKQFDDLSFIAYENFSDHVDILSANTQNNNNCKSFMYAIQEVTEDYYSIINTKGDVILDDVAIYSNSLVLSNNKVYMISNKNEIKEVVYDGHRGISLKYSINDRPISEESHTICELDNGKILIFDKNMNVIMNKEFDDAKYAYSDFVLIKDNSKWGVYDSRTKQYIITPQYDEMNWLYRGMYAVSKLIGKKCRWGVINNKNEELYPFENDEIVSATIQKDYTCIIVKKGTKYGIIKYDSEGRQEMVPFEYSYIDKVFDISEEDRGVSFFECHNDYGTTVIDSDGFEIIPMTRGISFISVGDSQITAEVQYAEDDDEYETEDIIGEISYCPQKRTSLGVRIDHNILYDSNMNTIYETTYDRYLSLVDNKYIIEQTNARGLSTDIVKILDLKGRILFSTEAHSLSSIGNDLFALFTTNGELKIIDKLGKTKYNLGSDVWYVPRVSDSIIYFIEAQENKQSRKSKGILMSIQTDGSKRKIDELNNLCHLGNFINSNLVELRTEDWKVGLYDLQNKKMIFNFDAWYFCDNGNGIEVRKDNDFHYYDYSGKEIFNNEGKKLWIL